MKVVLNLLCCLLPFPLDSFSLPSPLSEDSDLLRSGLDSKVSELMEEHFPLGEEATIKTLELSGISTGCCIVATGMIRSEQFCICNWNRKFKSLSRRSRSLSPRWKAFFMMFQLISCNWSTAVLMLLSTKELEKQPDTARTKSLANCAFATPK